MCRLRRTSDRNEPYQSRLEWFAVDCYRRQQFRRSREHSGLDSATAQTEAARRDQRQRRRAQTEGMDSEPESPACTANIPGAHLRREPDPLPSDAGAAAVLHSCRKEMFCSSGSVLPARLQTDCAGMAERSLDRNSWAHRSRCCEETRKRCHVPGSSPSGVTINAWAAGPLPYSAP